MNFYQELFKSLSKNDTDEEISNTQISNNKNNLCLITNEPLSYIHVSLECGHKFNYEPIFQEIKHQKKKYSNIYEVQILDRFEIKCPYCRNIQKSLLPPPPKKSGFESVYLVNRPIKYCMKPKNKCPYVFKGGKNKGTKCNKECYYIYCNNHYKEHTNIHTTEHISSKSNDNDDDNHDNSTNNLKNSLDNLEDKDNAKDTKCCAILVSGKRKGLKCDRKGKHFINNSYYCGTHKFYTVST